MVDRHTTARDRLIGCIVGGAIGDALGGPYEGLPGPVQVQSSQPWVTSDDTQLTVATCDAIASSGDILPAEIATRFVHLFRSKSLRGVGSTTLGALRALDACAHWASAGIEGEMAAGNGAAMRVAPLAFVLDPVSEIDRQSLRDICRITHRNEEAYLGALAIVWAVRLVISQSWSPGSDLLISVAERLSDSRVRDRLRSLAEDTDRDLVQLALEYGSSGYVVESVPISILVAQRCIHNGIHRALDVAVSLGGDTDTVTSMVGQICGAYHGYARVDQAVFSMLEDRAAILQAAERFSSFATKGV